MNNRTRYITVAFTVLMAHLTVPVNALGQDHGARAAGADTEDTPATSLDSVIPAELPGPDTKAPDMTKPLKVFIMSGQSNMVGMGRPESLMPLAKEDKKFHYLLDKDENWDTRNDVFFCNLTNRRITKYLTGDQKPGDQE